MDKLNSVAHSTKQEELSLIVMKWLMMLAGLGALAGGLIWLDMSQSRLSSESITPSRSRHPSQQFTEDEPARDRDMDSAMRTTGHRSSSAKRQTSAASRERESEVEETSDEPSYAELEAQRYEDNEKTFNERLETLTQELQRGGARQDTESGIAKRLEELLGETALLPVDFKTRCSDSVCELTFVGEGTAFQFAQTAGQSLLKVAKGGARGTAESQHVDGFDATASFQPQERDVPEESEEGLPAPSVSVRSIRYLIDVNDLALDAESAERPAEATVVEGDVPPTDEEGVHDASLPEAEIEPESPAAGEEPEAEDP